ncbi:hypothetical protein MPL3365_30527 [Mesorhizobium plurifarium]|uniref:Uncharacterized protein n=1 Tax=Mesorhizobium plurifarium TaxID=69974 RepID=A0A090GV90_MESPL|nr:hypothetical protein MPL3365_30527 [Mesorhizobium plurifarium]
MFVICSNFVRMSTTAKGPSERIRAARLGRVKERLAGLLCEHTAAVCDWPTADGFVILGRSKERSDARRP